MASSSRTAVRRKAPAKSSAAKTLGSLPEWNLADLYPSIDSPQVKSDLEAAEAECVSFENAYKGQLEKLATGPNPGAALAAPVKRYEALEDVLGRVISFSGLLYSGNTTDPAIGKFYGDMQERITAASTHLLLDKCCLYSSY